MKTYSFVKLANWFNKYPTGKMVSFLEGEVALEVMYLRIPTDTSSVGNYYLIYNNTNNSVYPSASMIPFTPTDFPNTSWVFLKPNGKRLKLKLYKEYREVIED